MAHGFEAVLLAVGVEVTASGLEVWSITLGLGVDVNAVLADGEVFEIQLDPDTIFEGLKVAVPASSPVLVFRGTTTAFLGSWRMPERQEG